MHDEILGMNRITATLFTLFGVAAVVLSSVGLYGVMSFSVNQRTQEFGIRMALGADARRILRMVMTQGAWQLVIGLFIGVGGTALLLWAIGAESAEELPLPREHLRYPLDLLARSRLCSPRWRRLSCFVPARRATRVNPIVALRAE